MIKNVIPDLDSWMEQTATPGTQRYPKFNITWDTDLQVSACTQDLGSSACRLHASTLVYNLPCREIDTMRGSQLLSLLLDRQDRQHQVCRDIPR